MKPPAVQIVPDCGNPVCRQCLIKMTLDVLDFAGVTDEALYQRAEAFARNLIAETKTKQLPRRLSAEKS